MERLLTTVLMISNGQDWITTDVQECIWTITSTYFSEKNLLYVGNYEMELGLQRNTMAYSYTKDVPPKHHRFDTIMIHRNLSSWNRSELRGKVLLITQTLDGVNILWTKLRLINLVVLLVSGKVIKVYTWFPYNQKFCRGEPPLLLQDTWNNGSLTKGINLFPQKIPQDFKGCPLVTSRIKCEPFSFKTGESFYGMEPDIELILLSSINAKRVMYDVPGPQQWYYISQSPNGSYSGVCWLLVERKIDIAGGCLMTGSDKALVSGHLPSHTGDYFAWFLPGPVPVSLAYGFATCLKDDIWVATGISFIVVYLFIIVAFPSSTSSNFIWLAARFMGYPYDIRISTLFEVFGLFLEFMLLILTSLYRSSLLITLFDTPFDSFEGPEDGADRGLITVLRPSFKYLYNNTNHEMWNSILAPGRSEISFDFNYLTITENRTHMTLGPYFIIRAQIEKSYSKQELIDKFFVPKPFFLQRSMAFLLPLNHPLIEHLTERMHRIVESGIPTFILSMYMNLLNEQSGTQDSSNKPLGLKHLLAVFYLLMGLSIGTLVVFVCEIVYEKFGKRKKVGKKELLRNMEAKRKRLSYFGRQIKVINF